MPFLLNKKLSTLSTAACQNLTHGCRLFSIPDLCGRLTNTEFLCRRGGTMDQILLCTNHIPLTTLIHNTFIENYMLEANGDYVKVYLYLAKSIQHRESGLSISALADRMDNTEKDVIRALQYWEKKKLLQINRNAHTGDIAGIDMLVPESSGSSTGPAGAAASAGYRTEQPDDPTDSPDAMPSASAGSGIPVSFPHREPIPHAQQNVYAETAAASFMTAPLMDTGHTAPYTAETNIVSLAEKNREHTAADKLSVPPQADAPASAHAAAKEVSVSNATLQELASNDEFVWTCHVVESYLDRPMKPNETRLISYLYGTLHFSKDLLLYLYEYCISLDKTNCNYIQAVALSWHEQGVTTPEEAEKVSTAYNSAYNAVSKSLALGRALAAVEKKCVDRWQNNWKMDLSVIIEACNRTILKIHKADFKYIEGILDHWQQMGVHTLQDVEKADFAYAQSRENGQKKTAAPSPAKSRNQFQNFQQRTASAQDVDDLERKLLMR